MPDEPAIVRSHVFAAFALIFVVAFVLRLSLAILFPDFGVAVPGEMERVAESWATTGQLANPYLSPTGPTAHVAPLYPVLMGSIYRTFGSGANGRFVLTVFSCVLSSLRCALLIPLAIVLKLGLRIGLLAAGLSTVYISAFNTELRGWWEAPLSALVLLALVMLAARLYQTPVFTARTAVGCGLFTGLALLVSPALLPTLAAFLILAGRPGLRMPKRYTGWLIGVIVVAGIVLLPWTVRNARVLGSPIVFRSNFGLELSLAFNDGQRLTNLDPETVSSHPLHNLAVSQEIARIGEVAFNRNRQQQAIDWIRTHPFAAARLIGGHIWYFWFPPSPFVIFRLILAFLTLFALAGLLLMYTMNREAGLLIGVVWATFPLTYYLTYWSSRYRYPMEWTLVLCSAIIIDRLWPWFSTRKPKPLAAQATRA